MGGLADFHSRDFSHQNLPVTGLQPVTITEQPESPGPVSPRWTGRAVAHQLTMQRHEVPGHIGEILNQPSRPSQVPIDQPGNHSASLQKVPRRDITVNNPPARPRPDRYPPPGTGGRDEIGRSIMESAQQPGGLHELSIPCQRCQRFAGQNRQDIAAGLIYPQMPRGSGESAPLQVP